MLVLAVGIAMPADTNAQTLKLGDDSDNPKIETVNRLLESIGHPDVNLTAIVASGAVVTDDRQKSSPLNEASLRGIFDKCLPATPDGHLVIGEDSLSIWMVCPSFGNAAWPAAHVIEFGFDGQKVKSVRSLTLIETQPTEKSN